MREKQKLPEDPGTTGTEDETIAAKKKRSRRVSFADVEITSVHIFNRDEDYYDSTPPSDPKPSDGTDSGGESQEGGRIGLFADLGDRSDDSPTAFDDKEDDGDVVVGGKLFFRPAETPSPGSSTIGSAFSNDEEDDFFGPVSASFIRPGRLSDSAASDENHDVTMDSTAFSMHFRSLARSDSGGDLKTPTRTNLVFEEKTPTPSVTAMNTGSLMALTNVRKLTQESSDPVNQVMSDGKDSNAMSLVGDNPRSYDYGRLSPSLDALLAEGSKDFHLISPSHLGNLKSSSVFKENGSSRQDVGDSGSHRMGKGNHGTKSAISVSHMEVMQADGVYKTMLSKDVMEGTPGLAGQSANLSIDSHVITSEQPIEGNKQSAEHVDDITGQSTGFSAITIGTPKSTSNKFLQHAAYQSSMDRQIKDNLLQNRRRITEFDHSSKASHSSPLTGFMSSLSAKGGELSPSALSSPAEFSTLTPEVRGSASLLSKEREKHGLSLSSIQKSITRLKRLDSSFSSSLESATEASKLNFSNFQFADSPYNTIRRESSTDILSKHVDTAGALRELLSNRKDVTNKPKFNLEDNRNDTPENIKKQRSLGQNVVVAASKEYEESQSHLHTSISCRDEPAEVTAVPSESGSRLMDILHPASDREASVSSILLVSSAERLDKRSADVKEFQNHMLRDLKDQPQVSRCTGGESKQDQTFLGNAILGGYLTHVAGELHPFSSMRTTRGGDRLDLLPGSTVKESQSGPDRASLQLEVSCGPQKGFCLPALDDLPFENPSKVSTESPMNRASSQSHRNDLCETLQVDSTELILGEGTLLSLQKSKNICVNDCQQESGHPEQSSPAQGLESHIKRTAEGAFSDVDHDRSVTKRICSEVGQFNASGVESCLRSSSYESEREKIGAVMSVRNWDDVLRNFREETTRILDPVLNQLNFNGIIMMEEILDYLHKARKYEMLRFEMQSQKLPDKSRNCLHKRSAETLLLLYKITYEKMQLLLNSVRRNNLQKMAQHLNSGIQDTRKLKGICQKNTSPTFGIYTQVGRNCHFCPADTQLKNEAAGTVIAMRHEHEVLDEKMKILANLLHKRCKIKGEQTCMDTTKLTADYIKRRMRCRLIHRDLQPWEVANLESSIGHHNIILNYLGFIYQSIMVTADPFSIAVSNKLEEVEIEKTFPNMGACSAFAYVFNAEATKKNIGSTSLAQKTQMTYSLLRNLLDVAEEVQLARLDNKDLINTNFHSTSGGRLDLRLSFLEYTSCQKVTVSLDMTCLNRGIYPSEVLPYHVEVHNNRAQNLLSQSVVTKIRDGAEGLKFGFQRIGRLCSCISKWVQDSRG